MSQETADPQWIRVILSCRGAGTVTKSRPGGHWFDKLPVWVRRLDF